MVDRINAACDTLLDDGDVDYISSDKCENLIDMINNLPDNYIPSEFQEIIAALMSYANRAVEYGTGIEIEI